MNQLLSPVAALDAQATVCPVLSDESETQQGLAFKGHGFELPNMGILIPPALRCEIVENLQTCPLPGTAAWLLGMTQLRGRILPVFDLQRLLFGNGNKLKSKNRMLVIEPQKKGLALVLPSIPRRLELSEQHILSGNGGVPEAIEPYCRKVFYDRVLWVELDIEALFNQVTQKLVVAH